MTRLFIGLLSVFLISAPMDALEGHDHAPGAVQAPHGGSMLKAKTFYLEVVTKRGGLIKIYPLNLERKVIALDKIRVTATTILPRQKEKKPLPLQAKNDHFDGKPEIKDTHRYTLQVAVSYGDEHELLDFQVEPQ